MAERSNAPTWKVGDLERGPEVRILFYPRKLIWSVKLDGF